MVNSGALVVKFARDFFIYYSFQIYSRVKEIASPSPASNFNIIQVNCNLHACIHTKSVFNESTFRSHPFEYAGYTR